MISFPITGKEVLFATLNWGLGHSSRSIPVIRQLLQQGNSITLASDGEALELLKKEFPHLPFLILPSYKILYKNSLPLIILNNFINIASAIVREHFYLRKLSKRKEYDIIISDSRFGFFNTSKYCIIISHQLNIQSSSHVLKWMINIANRFFINRFNECWVPDFENHKLSGVLSQNKKIESIRYIGPQSRMKKYQVEKKYDICLSLSGPEPSRTTLEKVLLNTLTDSPYTIALIRGTNAVLTHKAPNSWCVFNLLGSEQMNDILLASKLIISRSGYSSIMDYFVLETPAIVIPTPGQTEQEYLGRHLDDKVLFYNIEESKIPKVLLDTIDKILNP